MQKTNFKIKNEQMYVCIKAINSDIYEKLENCPFPFPGITKDNSLEYIIILVFFSFPSLCSSVLVPIDMLLLLSHVWLFCDPMDSSLPGSSSVHGISQARILECVAIFFSRGSSWPRDGIHVYCIGRWVLYHCATWFGFILLELSQLLESVSLWRLLNLASFQPLPLWVLLHFHPTLFFQNSGDICMSPAL